MSARRLRRAVVLSFPVAFALHDLEEVLTAGTWGRTAPDRIRRRFPRAPRRLVALSAMSGPRMALAVAVVSGGVAVATRSGLRHVDDGLELLRPALTAYTAHGVIHLLQSAALRGYTPGVATVPLVIAPYSAWAWHALRRAGLRRSPRQLRRDLGTGAALALGLAVSGQAVGALTTSGLRRAARPGDAGPGTLFPTVPPGAPSSR